jgi:hypothetical protein
MEQSAAGDRAGSSGRRAVTRRLATALVIAAVTGFQGGFETAVRAADEVAGSPPKALDGRVERYHYSVAARIRPLLVFWLSRSGVGDAVVTRQRAPGEASYSLLIGSDPDRAPRRINRWGYIEEQIRGAEAHLTGLMTESEEDTPEEAEASLRKQAAGNHLFKVIQATVSGQRATSLVRSIAAPEDYTLRQVRAVLDLALRESSAPTPRVIQLPPGTRPGFLAALADAIHAPAASPANFVYHGRLYELRQTRSLTIPNLRIGRTVYGRAIATDFVITKMRDGGQTEFSMTYGTEGPFVEVPLIVKYQPRWWMQVELTLDAGEAPALSDRAER